MSVQPHLFSPGEWSDTMARVGTESYLFEPSDRYANERSAPSPQCRGGLCGAGCLRFTGTVELRLVT